LFLLFFNRALTWIFKAQNQDGGWAAGQRFNESTDENNRKINVINVKSDPATTSMVVMAVLRYGGSRLKVNKQLNGKKHLVFY